MLRWLMTVAVSDGEKASCEASGGTGNLLAQELSHARGDGDQCGSLVSPGTTALLAS
jgi:hypothetical protein